MIVADTRALTLSGLEREEGGELRTAYLGQGRQGSQFCLCSLARLCDDNYSSSGRYLQSTTGQGCTATNVRNRCQETDPAKKVI